MKSFTNLIFAAGLLTLGLTGRAQPADDTDPEAVVKLDAFIVTGSNIPVTETAAESLTFPVLTLDRKSIDQTGYQSTAELLQKLTVSNGGSVPLSNNSAGYTPSATSTSIHGLGPEATLVLINGHRVASYPLGQDGTLAFVDLSTIPLAAIERIEVLKDGASALYGADAVAGVVNIILRKSYEHSEVSVEYGNTTDKDAAEFNASILTGATTEHGSISVAFTYGRHAAIYQRDRAYSAQPPLLSSFASPITAQITQAAYDEALGLPRGTPPPGLSAGKRTFYATPGITPGAPGGNTLAADGDPVANSTNFGTTPAGEYLYSGSRQPRYNYNLQASSYPDTTHYGVVLAGEQALFGQHKVTAYFDASAQKDTVKNELAPDPSGNFTTLGATELVIPARTPNPLPLPDGRARAAPAGAYNPFNPFNIDITGGSRFRFADFGDRTENDTNIAYLGTLGVRADNFLGTWNADVGVRYSQIQNRTDSRLISTSRLNQILNQADPIFNPASPSYIGTTVAYNPFGYYLNPIASNRAVLDYATIYVRDVATSKLGNGFATVNNPSLFAVPAGEVGVAGGLDFRREILAQTPDPFDAAGDILGSSAYAATNSSRDVLAGYAEMRVPVVAPAQGIPGLHELSLDGAGRVEDFITNHQAKFLPKLGLHWAPLGDTLAVRASYGRGIRQPSLYELYVGNSQGFSTFTDPRDGSTVTDVAILIKRNEQLRSETTRSATAGVVWTPKGPLTSLTFAADVWRVERDGTVSEDLQNTLDRFFGTAPGGAQPGEQVILDADGNITQVTSLYLNAGKTVAKGLDLTGSYLLPTARLGRFDFSVMASYLYSMKIAVLPLSPSMEMVNQATDGSAADGYLRWKGRADVTWTLHQFTANVGANFTDGFEDYDLDGNPYQIASTWTFDARLTTGFHGLFGKYLKKTKLSLGAINLTNRNPPVAYGGGANQTGYPGAIYTSVGRFVYAQLVQKF